MSERNTDLQVRLEDYEDVLMDPEIFVAMGGKLPGPRPPGDDVRVRVRRGVAQWEVDGGVEYDVPRVLKR